MADMKREIKDSVFTYLFRQPEYTLQLYQALHPEDTETAAEDLTLVTLENILSNGIYNDLGLRVRRTLILLMEAQSKFSVNICVRLLLYLAESYKRYVEERKLDLYAGKAVQIPRPELYVIYSGNQADVPEVLHLSDLYEGTGSVEVTVKVLRETGKRDILDQYIQFCKVSDEQRAKYGYTRKAVEETIRLCMEQDVLASFLASRQKEVTSIMITLFNQEKVSEIHDYNIAKDARAEGRNEGLAEGLAKGWTRGRNEGWTEGRNEGRNEERLMNLKLLMETLGLSAGEALDALRIAEEERPAYLELLSGP